jgi:hypothetical protein
MPIVKKVWGAVNALVEEAVFHEPEGMLKWGWFGGRRRFYGLVATKVELA